MASSQCPSRNPWLAMARLVMCQNPDRLSGYLKSVWKDEMCFTCLCKVVAFLAGSSSFAQKVCILKPGEVRLVCKLQSATEVAKLKCKLCQRKSETSIFESSRNLKGNHNSQIESWIICLNSSAYSRIQENTGTYRRLQIRAKREWFIFVARLAAEFLAD